jgi:hypothetical protein
MILKNHFHKGSEMINEFLCVASITAKPEQGQTKTGARTAQSRLEIVEYGDGGRAWRTWCPIISYGRTAEKLLGFSEHDMVVARGKLGWSSDAGGLVVVVRDITPFVVPADMEHDDGAA